MKPFLKQLAKFVLLQAFIAGLLGVHLLVGRDNHYLAAFRDKRANLQDHATPRVVFVGGSNLAFGLDSPLVQEQLGRRPVNTGLHAGLGLSLMLDLARDHVTAGDVVVVSPEYEILQDLTTNATTLQLVAHCPEAVRYVVRSWTDFLDRDAFFYAGQYTREGFRWWQHAGRQREAAPYRRDSFNAYGDVVAHRTLPGRDLSHDPPFQLPLSPAGLQRAIGLLNRFHDDCRQRGATVYLSFPPIPQEQFAVAKPTLIQIESVLRQELTIPLLDEAAEMTFPREEFFDTMYHLSGVGREHRTWKLLHNLSPRLRDDEGRHELARKAPAVVAPSEPAVHGSAEDAVKTLR